MISQLFVVAFIYLTYVQIALIWSFLVQLSLWKLVLWQPLDQCLIAAQTVNLTGGISSRNTSCVFTKELNREPQQYSTNYLYKCPWFILRLLCAYLNIHALSSYPLVICLMSYYSSTMHLPQDQHAIYMCPDIIPSTLLLISVIYTCTIYIPWETMSLDITPTLDFSWSFQTTLDYSRPYDIMSCDFIVMCLLSLVID